MPSPNRSRREHWRQEDDKAYSVEQRLSAFMTTMGSVWITSPQTTTSTSPVNVTGLAWPIVSGATYRFKMFLRLSQNAGGTMAMTAGLSGPSVSMAMLASWSINEGGGGSTPATGESASFPTSSGTSTGNGVKWAWIDGIFTASASGTLQATFNSSTPGTTQVNTGSYLDVWQVG